MPLPVDAVSTIVRLALTEDIGEGDVTTRATMEQVSAGSGLAKARIIAKEPAVVAGLLLAEEVWKQVDPQLTLKLTSQDGDRVEIGGSVLEVEGSAASILIGERTALNFLQQLSGVATTTRGFVDAVAGFKTKIADTRKTVAGLRALQKYAVRCGGGVNHRAGLYDQFLFKDNHLALCGRPEMLAEAIQLARKLRPDLPVEVEADRIDQVREIIKLKPDIILLDNMTLEETRACVELIGDLPIKTEASGNMSLERVRAVAETGVDYISVGALTHSVRAIDLSLEIWAT